jgi:hypothetical protein
VHLNNSKSDTTNNVPNSSEAKDNLFFFKGKVSMVSYTGNVYFSEGDIKLNINELAELKYGKVFELKLDSYKDVLDDRLNLGYFYVQKDKIYRIKPTEENLNKLKTSGQVPNDSVIVCQDGELKDALSKDEKGWHHYILVNGDTRESHSYNNQVETGFYETYIWESNRGLIKYSSGFGAGRDAINLQINSN